MLYLYIGLVASTAIWASKKEALLMVVVWFVGLFISVAIGEEGKESGNIFIIYQATFGIFMAFRIHLKMNNKHSNISTTHSSEPFEFTPLDHESNDPRILSKHPIEGPDPRTQE